MTMEEIRWKYGDDVRYAYAVGVIRVLETRLLSRERVDRAADASSAEEVLRILGETSYSEYLSGLTDPADYETFLESERENTLNLLEKLTQDPPLTDLFLYRFDFHNLKVALKERFGGQDLASAYIPLGKIAVPVIKTAVTDEDFSPLPGWLAEPGGQVVREFPERQDPKWIDLLIDRKMYEYFLAVSRERGSLFLHDLITREIDLINILSFFRIRRSAQERRFFQEAFIGGGSLPFHFFLQFFDEPIETAPGRFAHTPYRAMVENGWDHLITHGSFAVFEQAGRDFLLDHLRKAKLVAFGIEPLVAYVHAKENELRMIRTIMVGKLNNVESNVIKESLPRVYL
jgi:V/A-type H+-transporting ATPase subunit C